MNRFVEEAIETADLDMSLDMKIDNTDHSRMAYHSSNLLTGQVVLGINEQVMKDRDLDTVRYIIHHEVGHAQDAFLSLREWIPVIVAPVVFIGCNSLLSQNKKLSTSTFLLSTETLSFVIGQGASYLSHNMVKNRHERVADQFAVTNLNKAGKNEAIGAWTNTLKSCCNSEKYVPYLTYPNSCEKHHYITAMISNLSKTKTQSES